MKRYIIGLILITLLVCGCSKKEINETEVKNDDLETEKNTQELINEATFVTKAYIISEVANNNESITYKCVLSSLSCDKIGLYKINVANEVSSDASGKLIKLEPKLIYEVVLEIESKDGIHKAIKVNHETDSTKPDWDEGRHKFSTFDKDFEELKKLSPKEAYNKVYNELQYKWAYEQIDVYKAYMEQQMQTSEELKKTWNDAYASVGKTLGY